MNLGEYLANIILEAEDQPTIALFPGAFKPPHKGHVDVVNKLLKAADQVVVLVSPKTREGVTSDESIAVWNLYKDKGLFNGSVEIKISADPSPVKEVYGVIKDNPDTNFLVAFGKGDIVRYKGIEKYPNVKVFDADETEGASATNLRMALAQTNEEDIAEYLPTGVSVDEFLQALNTKPEEKSKETPAEQPPAEQPAPEQSLQESPPINFDEPPYQDYILANRPKIEKAAAVFNIPIDDMEYAFNGGDEVVLNDDMWKEMENTKSYNMKTLEDAISHALKIGINPKPYIDHIKQKKDIPLPLVLQWQQGKYYLVGGEVILSIYRSLGVIPTVLLATLNLQTKTLPEPLNEAYEKVIKDEGPEFSRVAKEFNIPKKKLEQVFTEKGKITKLTDDIWSKLENTDSWDIESEEDAIRFAKKYSKNWKPTLDAIKAKKEINPPLILQYDKDKYHLVGGNTRLMFSKALGITPKVLIATLPKPLNEVLGEDRLQTVKKFMKYAINELDIQKPPTGITLSNNNDKAKSKHTFGTFNPNNDKIWLYVKNRNMADLLRTLAHELVHRKQAEDGRLEPNSGETGSEIENEANAMAGVLLRKFGEQNENIYEAKKNFGDYLFGDKESGVKIGWYDSEKEEDTPAEQELFNYLKKYAASESSTYSTLSLDHLIPIFKKIKKQYPEIGDPKVSDYVYRGTVASQDKLEKLLKEPNVEEIGQNIIIPNQEYSSRRKVSSWSTNYYNAAAFAMGTSERKGGVPVVVRAKASDAELFFNPKFMNKLSDQLEEEVFNIINPIPVDIMVIKEYEDEFEDIEAGYLHTKQK